MSARSVGLVFSAAVILVGAALPAAAQSFMVQCPTGTITHPDPSKTGVNNAEPAYTAASNVNGAIKCQQISGGDGYATMADGTQTYMFSFGPLSGLANIAAGLPGTVFPKDFNSPYSGSTPLQPGDPATTLDAGGSFTYNGAIGVIPDLDACGGDPSCVSSPPITGHVDTRQIMDIGVMNGNIPAPLMALDEDDEFFLTLTNVGMIMRPDLFEQHTVHFHGYPNASSFYDGVPDASVAINIGGSFTYYYLAPDAGTYFWHCHITPPEHLQMGMVGQVYVRPRQNRVLPSTTVFKALEVQQADNRTACNSAADILCTNPLPAGYSDANDSSPAGGFVAANTADPETKKYAYNDGDGSTEYDVEYPLQIHGFDPNFHFVGMTFNPEGFADMKDKYFLLNGRSYPDTIHAGAMETQTTDGANHFSQPLSAIINIPAGGRALLRISDLDVSEYQTLASLGIPMTVIGYNAKLLRDQQGHNMYYKTNSITLGGGESLDVILDTCGKRDSALKCVAGTQIPSGTYYLYTPNLDHLANDAENFGGLMTEVRVTN